MTEKYSPRLTSLISYSPMTTTSQLVPEYVYNTHTHTHTHTHIHAKVTLMMHGFNRENPFTLVQIQYGKGWPHTTNTWKRQRKIKRD